MKRWGSLVALAVFALIIRASTRSGPASATYASEKEASGPHRSKPEDTVASALTAPLARPIARSAPRPGAPSPAAPPPWWEGKRTGSYADAARQARDFEQTLHTMRVEDIMAAAEKMHMPTATLEKLLGWEDAASRLVVERYSDAILTAADYSRARQETAKIQIAQNDAVTELLGLDEMNRFTRLVNKSRHGNLAYADDQGFYPGEAEAIARSKTTGTGVSFTTPAPSAEARAAYADRFKR